MRIRAGDLREMLANVPDETPVVLHGSDHSYRWFYHGTMINAIASPYTENLTEPNDIDNPSLGDDEKIVKAFLLE